MYYSDKEALLPWINTNQVTQSLLQKQSNQQAQKNKAAKLITPKVKIKRNTHSLQKNMQEQSQKFITINELQAQLKNQLPISAVKEATSTESTENKVFQACLETSFTQAQSLMTNKELQSKRYNLDKVKACCLDEFKVQEETAELTKITLESKAGKEGSTVLTEFDESVVQEKIQSMQQSIKTLNQALNQVYEQLAESKYAEKIAVTKLKNEAIDDGPAAIIKTDETTKNTYDYGMQKANRGLQTLFFGSGLPSLRLRKNTSKLSLNVSSPSSQENPANALAIFKVVTSAEAEGSIKNNLQVLES